MITLTFQLVLLSTWKKSEAQQYRNLCEELTREAATAGVNDTVHLSIGEVQGNSTLRATIWRDRATLVSGDWEPSKERDADGHTRHVYKKGFGYEEDNPADVVASCRTMVLASVLP